MIFEGVSAAHTSTNPSTHIARPGPGPGAAHAAAGPGHLTHHFASASQLPLVNATSKIVSPARRMSSVTQSRLAELPSPAASPCTGTSTGPNAPSVPGSGPHSPAQAQARSPWHPHTPLHAAVWHRASDTASPYSLRSGAALDHQGPGPGSATSPCTAPLVRTAIPTILLRSTLTCATSGAACVL